MKTSVEERAGAAYGFATVLFLIAVLAAALFAAPGAAFASNGETPGAEGLAAGADGTYQVQARLMNASNPSQPSMADAAMTKPVTVTVKDGAYAVTVGLGPIQRDLGAVTFTGYLRYLRYWDGSSYQDTTVLDTYDAVDSYNRASDGTASYLYPKTVSFPLVNGQSGDDASGFVHLQVYVPVMAAINPDSGTQPVLMQLDWPAKHQASLTALQSTLASAKAVSNASGAYTADSFAALTTAIASAEKAAAASDSSFWDYDDAADAITQARAGLVKAAVSSSQTQATVKKNIGYAKGKSAVKAGNTYKVTSNGTGAKATVSLVKAKNVKRVTVPATVRLNGKAYRVTAISAKAFAKASKARAVTVGKYVKKIAKNAFKGSKVTKLTVKTKQLTKRSVKGSLKASKVKTVTVNVGKAAADKKYVKKYKKIFTKANCGKKVAVRR